MCITNICLAEQQVCTCITNIWLAKKQDCTCTTNISLTKQEEFTCITNVWSSKQQDFTSITNVSLSKQEDCTTVENTALFGPVHKYPFLFETGDFFGHRKRYIFKNVLQTEDFWKHWLLVYVWTDKNGSFRKRWCHSSFTTSITFPLFNVFYGRAKTIRIRYLWTRIFLKTEQKISVLKNIQICVNGAFVAELPLWSVSSWLFKSIERFHSRGQHLC